MPYLVQLKGASLLLLLLVQTLLASPVVRRDLSYVSDTAIADPSQTQLVADDVFGGETLEGNGVREKRLLKLKAIGLGAGAKAVGAGLKAVGGAAAKAVGKKAVKAAVVVGGKLAKAAVSIGIAKLLLSLVFGKINGLLAFKSKLLPHGLLSVSNSGTGGGHTGGGAHASAGVDGGIGVGASAELEGGYGGIVTTEALPEIDPEKVSLQVPDGIISGGFNVVNKAAPVFGEVIQRTAERVAGLVSNLKPAISASYGYNAYKRAPITDDLSDLAYPK